MNEVIKSLNWRASVKKFDTKKKLSSEDLGTLMETLRLTPSSFGFQPWKFLFIKDQEIKEKLMECSRGQKQVFEAEYLVVFCGKKDFSERDIEKYVEFMAKERGLNVDETIEKLKNN